ncbi:MAG: chorismate-binding protein [Maribacter sp.]|nr:chorismate-binding protein [Maribacter sp.]
MFLDIITKTEAHLAKDLPFVIYRRPHETAVNALFQNDAKVRYSINYTESGFVFAPFDTARGAILIAADETLQAIDFTERVVPSVRQNLLKINPQTKKIYLEKVKNAIDEIKKNDYRKVVLSRQLDVGCSLSPIVLLQRVLARYHSAFCYLWYHPKVGMWLGATPEILVQIENKQVMAMSLAGTHSSDKGQLHVWGAKEIGEQAFVTEYIAKALENNVSDLKISASQSVPAGKLWHLRTKLTGTLQNTLSDIIKALHPTPAVCGIPKEWAKNYIQGHESYDREFYTGFLGELNMRQTKARSADNKNHELRAFRPIKKSTRLYVNIRCMQLKNSKALIYVGGGLTRESIPELEWQETVAKSTTMFSILFGQN